MSQRIVSDKPVDAELGSNITKFDFNMRKRGIANFISSIA